MNPMSDPSPSDIDRLLARARAGDRIAWEELFRECYPKVLRVVRRRLNKPLRTVYDSTDFASDVMKSLAANIGRLDFESYDALLAFLTEVASQKVIDEHRKENALKRDVKRREPLGADGGGGIASDTPTASKFAQAEEARAALLDGQNAPGREVIKLKESGHSNQEVAKQVGWNIKKVQRFLKDLEDRYRRRRA
jgi:RNA polymerase sigma-70 factor (ECF subfamily)